MTMDGFATTSQMLMNRLRDQIYEYVYRNGEPPKFIIVSSRAYWLIENYAKGFCIRQTRLGPVPYFGNIEVRIVYGDGYEIFLAGEPITLRE